MLVTYDPKRKSIYVHVKEYKTGNNKERVELLSTEYLEQGVVIDYNDADEIVGYEFTGVVLETVQ